MGATTRTVAVASALLFATARAALAANDAGDRASSPRPDQQLAAIQTSLEAGQGQKALELLNSRTLDLSGADRLLLEGRAYLAMGDNAEAREKLESALRAQAGESAAQPSVLGTQHSTLLYWLGRAYEADGAPGLAAEQYQQAHRAGLADADLHYHWAAALKASGELLGEVARCGPPSGEARESRSPGQLACGGVVVGAVASKPGWVVVSPPASAVYQIHQALRLEPDRGDALLLCAEIWGAARLHQEAVARYAKAITKLENPEELARCHEGWAASLLALGNLDGYLKHTTERFRIAGQVDSAELARAYALAAKTVAQQGDLQRQIRYLTMSVELDPDPQRQIDLADALTSAQRVSEAEERLKKALEQNPTAEQRHKIHRRLSEAKYYLASPKQ